MTSCNCRKNKYTILYHVPFPQIQRALENTTGIFTINVSFKQWSMVNYFLLFSMIWKKKQALKVTFSLRKKKCFISDVKLYELVVRKMVLNIASREFKYEIKHFKYGRFHMTLPILEVMLVLTMYTNPVKII